MFTTAHWQVIKTFATLNEEHIYGHCTIYKPDGNPMATAAINSAEEGSCDYFCTGSVDISLFICGTPINTIGHIQLTKGIGKDANTLSITDNKIK